MNRHVGRTVKQEVPSGTPPAGRYAEGPWVTFNDGPTDSRVEVVKVARLRVVHLPVPRAPHQH